ncbi:enoyl-CoA hydratase/isomerase family protein [Actinomadura xylanilytica]|uniref:enoyl-CoA hydratase/isomerase family protein n=1 Tax=Actinomadura xylanilytica TaxID=887459 RepID=UPI00255A7CD1|nr:enoyl-CoA hydratase/isomerase family protein [Actinomadura xylanilytica]MDL4775256.1 enoyl-CoA hydratase/isomerase family protein [Actinomadura xylanilytica]
MDYSDLAPDLLVEVDGPLRIVTMNRPDALNSFDDALHVGMRRVWDLLVDDEDARAVVLTGAGRAFSAGGHVPNFIRNHHDPVARRRDIREGERLVRAMLSCELPVVAAVNGPAVGLGCSLATMSDFVVMSEDAFLSDPHVNIGLVAGDGGAVTWPWLTSMLTAKEFLLLGDRLHAAEAARAGLCNRVVPAGEVLETAKAFAHRFAELPAQSVRDTKRALNMHLLDSANNVLNFALAAEHESFGTDDIKARVAQFLAKDGKKSTDAPATQ